MVDTARDRVDDPRVLASHPRHDDGAREGERPNPLRYGDGARGLGCAAGGDDLVIGEGGGLDDDLEQHRGLRDVADGADLMLDLVELPGAGEAHVDHHVDLVGAGRDGVLSYEALLDGHEPLETAGLPNVSERSASGACYTTGTTGRPKGAELTHANFVDTTRSAVTLLGEKVLPSGSRLLMFLPMAHVFARLITVLDAAWPVTTAFTPDTKNLLPDLAAFKPTFLLAVPRVFEKVYNGAEAKAIASGKGRIFGAAAKTAIDYSTALADGKVPLTLSLKHKLFDRLVYGTLREAMGGQVRWAVSGGAPLGARLSHFFRGIGVTVLEGYGLTETTAPICVNLPWDVRPGTVGPPLPGSSVAIDDSGELLVKGVMVFKGYHNNPEATAESLKDGWFHTGDLGSLADDGSITITGRRKEVIVTAGGKNVSPAQLEDQLRSHPLVSQCVVIGDQKPFVAAILTLDAEMLPTWLKNNGKPEMSLTQAAEDPEIRAELQKVVDRANESVSRAESIRSFVVIDSDFTEENGYLTPSLKLKRNVVVKDLAPIIEKIYSAPKPQG